MKESVIGAHYRQVLDSQVEKHVVVMCVCVCVSDMTFQLNEEALTCQQWTISHHSLSLCFNV